MTVFQKIKTMNVEKMASFLYDFTLGCDCCPAEKGGEALEKWLESESDINTMPTIESPVKQGKWIEEDGMFLNFHCSVCGKKALYAEHPSDYTTEYFLTDYCPNCGARLEV